MNLGTFLSLEIICTTYFGDAAHTCRNFTMHNYTGHACEFYKFNFNYKYSFILSPHHKMSRGIMELQLH